MANLNKSEIACFVEKFTMGNMLDGKKKLRDPIYFSDKPAINQTVTLPDNVVISLRTIGLSYDQIVFAFKIYKFTSVEQAVQIILRDIETKKFNHYFYPDPDIKDKEVCQICGNSSKDHQEKEPIKKEEVDVNSKNQPIHNSNRKSNRKIPEDNKLNEVIMVNSVVNQTKDNNISNEDAIPYKINSKRSQVSKSERNDRIEENNEKNDKPDLNIKKIALNFSQEVVEMLEDPKLCTICYTNTKEIDIIFSCNHKFCLTCIQMHLNTRIINGRVADIQCLSAGCTRIFSDEEVKKFVSNDIYLKYKKFKLNQMKLNKKNENFVIVNCPHPDCEEIKEFDPKDDNTFVECQNNHKFCVKCLNEGWHKKSECKTNNLIEQIKEKNESLNFKQCPFCSVVIEKNEGCNQMKCINCNNEFCWLCLRKYTNDHYALYNFRGCPGMRFVTEKKKKCWDNKVLKLLWYMLSCFLGFLAFIFVIIFFSVFGCSYEFCKCYIERNNKSESEEDEESNYDHNFQQINGNTSETNVNNQNNLNEIHPLDKTDIFMLILLSILGILMQPLYLVFYLLLGLMECYRKFNCWFYYY